MPWIPSRRNRKERVFPSGEILTVDIFLSLIKSSIETPKALEVLNIRLKKMLSSRVAFFVGNLFIKYSLFLLFGSKNKQLFSNLCVFLKLLANIYIRHNISLTFTDLNQYGNHPNNNTSI